VILSPAIYEFCEQTESSSYFSGGAIHFPAGGCVIGYSFLTASAFSQAGFFNITYNNAAGVNGPKVNLSQFTSVMTNDGTLASIPGSTLGIIDNTSWLTAYGRPLSTVKGGGYLLEQFTDLPTVDQVPDGTLKWVKETTGGGLYIVANDGGTIKTIGMNGDYVPIAGGR
jgi:hypothetical protein